MALRPARIYKKFKRPYTRTAVKVHKKEYIKGVPGSKLRLFNMGNKKFEAECEVSLTMNEDVQVRHNALEAARVAANAYLRKNIEEKNYFLRVRVYPHHVLREHAQAAVAQADRFYDGMAHPFGKPSGTAARVRKGQPILSVGVLEKDLNYAKECLKRAGAKMPGKTRVNVE